MIVQNRGSQLLQGAGRARQQPSLITRIWAGAFGRILDKIERTIERGTIEAHLPDGSVRFFRGAEPGFTAVVSLHSPNALLRLVTRGTVGCYQGWVAGDWSSPDPVALFALFADNSNGLRDLSSARGPWKILSRFVHSARKNTREGSLRNIHAHYDLGNDFYTAWLDPTMSYSSALFDPPGIDLEAAQKQKIAAIADRIGDAKSVLEIGCGWGSLAAHIAKKGAAVTAISLSDEQLTWGRYYHKELSIDFRKQDYRDVSGQFDGIVSVEMVEAVGQDYWPSYFDCIARCLKPGGRAAIQYISIRDDLFDVYASQADFIQTYIFPGGMLIRESAFQKLAAERGLQWQDCQTFGRDYTETLRQWRVRFDLAVKADQLPQGFDESFYALWRFYLMYCEAGFMAGAIDVSQVTLVKPE